MKNIEDINKASIKKILAEKKITDFSPGDTIKVGVKIIEGKRERIQFIEGVCIAKKNRDINSSFTVRKISFGEGVERTFALYSPNIDSIKVITDENHSRDIKLDDNYTLRMKYPSLMEFIKNNFASAEMGVDDTFDLISSCIEQVYSEEESWTAEDCTKKELSQFLDQLNSSQFKEIEKFFETMPKLSHKVKVTNPNTKVESEIVLEGLQNFFG